MHATRSEETVRRTLGEYDPFRSPYRITIRVELADCSRKWHWASVATCRRQFDAAMGCTKQQ